LPSLSDPGHLLPQAPARALRTIPAPPPPPLPSIGSVSVSVKILDSGATTAVTPAEAGVHALSEGLDSRIRGNDVCKLPHLPFSTDL